MSEQERDEHGRFAGGGSPGDTAREKYAPLKDKANDASLKANKSGSKEDHAAAASAQRTAGAAAKEGAKSTDAAEHFDKAAAHDKAAGKSNAGRLDSMRGRNVTQGSGKSGLDLWSSKVKSAFEGQKRAKVSK